MARGPRLAEAARVEGTEIFRWETAHRGDARRFSRKVAQCVGDLLAFCVVPLSALAVYWAGGTFTQGLLIVSVTEALAVVDLGVYIVLYAVPFGSGTAVG